MNNDLFSKKKVLDILYLAANSISAVESSYKGTERAAIHKARVYFLQALRNIEAMPSEFNFDVVVSKLETLAAEYEERANNKYLGAEKKKNLAKMNSYRYAYNIVKDGGIGTLHKPNEVDVVKDWNTRYMESYIEQLRWERDVALSQLRELDIELGEKIERGGIGGN